MGMKISQVVEETERDSKQHVDDSQDNRHLHLERVQECQLVGGDVPYLRDKTVKDGMSTELTKSNITICFNSILYLLTLYFVLLMQYIQQQTIIDDIFLTDV